MNPIFSKYKAVMLYVLNETGGNMGRHQLFKIIYFANIEHLAVYGRGIIDDRFVAMENGPVPSKLYDIIKDYGNPHTPVDWKYIHDSIRVVKKGKHSVIFPVDFADEDELSISEIDCLRKSVTENKDLKFKDIVYKSHKDAWNNAYSKKPNSNMDIFDMAKEGGASDDMLDYIEDINYCF